MFLGNTRVALAWEVFVPSLPIGKTATWRFADAASLGRTFAERQSPHYGSLTEWPLSADLWVTNPAKNGGEKAK